MEIFCFFKINFRLVENYSWCSNLDQAKDDINTSFLVVPQKYTVPQKNIPPLEKTEGSLIGYKKELNLA
jgi:hypothetical protein